MVSNNYIVSLVFDIYILRSAFYNWYLEVLLGVPLGRVLSFGGPFGGPGPVGGSFWAQFEFWKSLCGQQKLKDANHDE